MIATENEKKRLYRQSAIGRERHAEQQRTYREKKREEKAALKLKETQNENLKHNIKIHKHWTKTYRFEAEALKLEAFPDKILG